MASSRRTAIISVPCVFCEIVAGLSPASRIAESSTALAFLTIGPLREGHTLVIPKRHAVELADATAEELAGIFELSAEVARRQRKALGSLGETLFLASGKAGEQVVSHLHLHVVPRGPGDGLNLTEWWEAHVLKPKRESLDDVAGKLRGSP